MRLAQDAACRCTQLAHDPSHLAILAGVPQAQQVDGGAFYLLAHRTVPDQNPPHVSRIELFQPLADARVGQQRGRCDCEVLHRAARSGLVHRRQELIEADQIGQGLARPLVDSLSSSQQCPDLHPPLAQC